MKVKHFSTFPYGGAATAARRIHEQLNQLSDVSDANVDSQFCYFRNDKNSQLDATFEQVEFAPEKFGLLASTISKRRKKRRQREIYRQFNEHVAARPPGAETFSMAELPEPTKLNWPSGGTNADIIHLHWLAFFADYPTFFNSIPDSVPLVWTLHDMNAFTGGCHYANQCQHFRFGCGDCEQVLNRGRDDVSRTGFAAKQKSLANKVIHVVSPSDWLSELAQKSPLWPQSTSFQTIKYGLDLEQFRPVKKSIAREQLGIHSDAILIGFGADDIHNHRKGIHHLLAALRLLESQEFLVNQRSQPNHESLPRWEGLLFGAGKIEDSSGLPKLHQMGYVDSIERQRLIYSAADLVVVPSREDNQPQVGLEAMACGTPVVAFRAGGIPEYVRSGVTGLLAIVGNENELAAKILQLVSESDLRQRLGRAARAMMETEFESVTQTQNYLHLYESLMGYREISRAA